jgi:hypothetical protein
MSPREKKLLFILIGVLGLCLLTAGVWMWFVVPLRSYNTTIALMSLDVNGKQKELEDFTRERKKLVMARFKSLPTAENEAKIEYVNYLHSILPRAGLRVEEVTPALNAVKMKPISNIPGIKEVGHQMLSFQVKARGTMATLAAALNEFQQTPYEHRIKNMTIDRADTSKDENAKLIINLIIECLLVSKAESKPGVPPGVDARGALFDSVASHYSMPVAGLGQMFATAYFMQTKPVETSRRYADMTKRNIFVGLTPKIEIVKEKVEIDTTTPPPRSPGPIPRYVRLVGIETTKGEAHYLNLFYKKDERKISEKENSGYNTFLIAADDLSYTFFLGKVLKVDNRDVFFQVKDKVYRWHLGDSLESAYGEDGVNFLTRDYLDVVDVEPDFAWGRKELEKEKAKDVPKKKFGKGRN